MATRATVPAQRGNPARSTINAPTGETFKITDTKLYIPVVTLSTQDDNKLLQQLKTGFKRTIKRNKYRPGISNQTKNNNLNFLIDPTFIKASRLFVLWIENENNRISFSKYDTPNVEIKDFHVLIDSESFFDTPIKNKEEEYEKIFTIGKDNDYTTGDLLDYKYFSKHDKLITIDLSKEIKLENPDFKQQVNFIGRLDRDNRATMFCIIENSEETALEFSQNAVIII